MGTKSFKELTTFRIGGEISEYKEVSNKEELLQAIRSAKSNNLEIFILGEGSDLLVSDHAYHGMVIKYVGSKIDIKDDIVFAEAGVIWDDLVKEAVDKNLQGIECLSGIPGTVGAAPVQNIGAYGQELKDSFIKLTALDIKNEKFITLENKDCEFSYRQSIFKKDEYWQKLVIVDVTFKLNKETKTEIKYESLKNYLSLNNITEPSLKEVRNAVLDIRTRKFENPKEVGNAGSFFKNPVITESLGKVMLTKYSDISLHQLSDGSYKCFAGWLIEKAGWKGKSYKTAAVSKNHALVLINPDGNAKAQDVLDLSNKIIEAVQSEFGIKLEPEVQFINFN